MPRLDSQTRALARDLTASMRSFDPEGPSALSWITPELPRLIRSEEVNVFTFRQHSEHLSLGSMHRVGLPPHSERLFDQWLARQPPVGWSNYNPVRPQPVQRNRVLDKATIERLTGQPHATLPIMDFLRSMRLEHKDQLRVLICEDASLLAYVGTYQQEGFTAHQKSALAAIVPSLGRRLRLERLVANGARQAAALDAALAAIGRPAFVASARGTIHELNASARALLEREGADVRRGLVDAIAGRRGRYAFELTTLRIVGGAPCHLAILRDVAEDARQETCALSAAARWGLTPRRREVLGMLVRGMTNAAIAAEMGVSERAVEGHVTAIFDRSGVSNRAALVALVMRAAT